MKITDDGSRESHKTFDYPSSSPDVYGPGCAGVANSSSSQDSPAKANSEILPRTEKDANINHSYDGHNGQHKFSNLWYRRWALLNHHSSARWPKTILVRYRNNVGHNNSGLVYSRIVLPSSDLQALVYAICPERVLEDAAEISVQWIDPVQRLTGTVDESFLLDTAELQDFVVDMIWKPTDHLLITLEW